MTDQHTAIDGPVARDLLDALVSFLPIFERPGYCFGVRGADEYDQKLSTEAKAFIATVCELRNHFYRSLPHGRDSPQWDTGRRIMFQDSELLATTDLAVLCLALYWQIRTYDLARGGPGALRWFEGEGFLPLLRHIKELCTRPAEK